MDGCIPCNLSQTRAHTRRHARVLQLFALPDRTLPVDSQLREWLEQPIAEAKCEGSLLATEGWQWRAPTQETFQMQIEGSGKRIASWLARLELPDYRSQQIWDRIYITVPSEVMLSCENSLNGTYQALPMCGTASDSLYKKVDTAAGALPIYLLQNSTRTGEQFCFHH